MSNLVLRSEKLAFYGVKVEGNTVYHRMTGFTDLTTSKNPKEYTRQYVDEAFEQTDITGFSPSTAFAFDMYQGNLVHEDIAKISEEELVGDEAVREIVLVDLTKKNEDGSYKAVKREFTVVPDTEGGGVEAYNITGNLKVKGARVIGKATSADELETVSFE